MKDNRGEKNKISNAKKVNKIISRIDKFPKYVSHYCRAQTSTKFLAPDELYQSW